MNHLQIILITDIHKNDAFYKKNPIGYIFIINNDSIIEPSKEGKGFMFFKNIKAISKKFEYATCFYAVKYKVLFGVQA